MSKKSIRGDILEIARVLREFARTGSDADWRKFRPGFPMGADARAYAEAARRLTSDANRADAVKAEFRPFFLANGFIQATQCADHARRAFLLEALAAGLAEFADYFDAIHPDRLRPEETDEECERLRAEQKRYAAYCAAQLTECGMDMEGVWMTLKGDALDVETSAQIRAILEEGPERVAACALFSDEEKRLWAAAGSGGPEAFEALQRALVAAHKLPFKKAPAD
jgi:hypothetical protein